MVRVDEPERTTFLTAAELSGVSLSAWIRQKLRQASAKELTESGVPVEFMEARISQ